MDNDELVRAFWAALRDRVKRALPELDLSPMYRGIAERFAAGQSQDEIAEAMGSRNGYLPVVIVCIKNLAIKVGLPFPDPDDQLPDPGEYEAPKS